MADVHKDRVRAAFDRAAPAYDALAGFQHQVCAHLLTLLPSVQPARVLDVGCGTGYGAALLQQRWPQAEVVGCDLAPAMVQQMRARGLAAVCADAEALPLADASVDLVWSSLALQWCDAQRALAEWQRVVRPGGYLVVSTLAPGTLREWAQAFADLDRHDHVLPLVPGHALEQLLVAQGWADVQLQQTPWVTRHADLRALLASIRGIGANQIGSTRRQAWLGKQAWRTAMDRYEALRGADGLLPATYEVIAIVARKNAGSQ